MIKYKIEKIVPSVLKGVIKLVGTAFEKILVLLKIEGRKSVNIND